MSNPKSNAGKTNAGAEPTPDQEGAKTSQPDVSGIRCHLEDSGVLKRVWSAKIDPFDMVMVLSSPMSDDFTKLSKMMEKADVKEITIDPNNSVLKFKDTELTLTISCQYWDISTFKAAMTKWGLSVGPSMFSEAARTLVKRSEMFTELSRSLKSKARTELEARLAERDALNHRLKSMESQIADINAALSKSVVDMIREERLLSSVTWQRVSDKSSEGTNMFRHLRCPELNPLTSLMGLVNPDDPTIKLDGQVRIISHVPMTTKVIRYKDGTKKVESDPPTIAIVHRGSFLEAAAFVKDWKIRWVEAEKK